MAQLYYGDTPLAQMPASYPANRVTHESVSVTADGVKTNKDLLTSLHTLIDFTKVSQNTRLVAMNPGGDYSILPIRYNGLNHAYFDATFISSNAVSINEILIHQTGSFWHMVLAGSYQDVSSSVASSGYVFTLYYD